MAILEVFGPEDRAAKRVAQAATRQQRLETIAARGKGVLVRMQIQVYDPGRERYMGWPNASVSLRASTLEDASAAVDTLFACVDCIRTDGPTGVLDKLGVSVQHEPTEDESRALDT